MYAGHDEAHGDQMFNITEWLCYSTKEMKNWTAHGSIMKPMDFKWAVGEAGASQVVEKDGLWIRQYGFKSMLEAIMKR